ncbi:DUF4262 domain-containing protein [Amycolatopsis balhimycina DSM 5908]|uniref:DUF4262 domain-containing protein n=1 Tax=Amycolatopsis balhimycina DSM 5908 TaxID=1081091 RepID=A0A428X2M0_AMYBA|nr:DUF4262 domain-containing protein [Amycolatopsis balhimycina]RSM49566.1 DUF4262 domain-containing protein [Amycolatopsis balhimycina DSM 5908]
MCWQCDNPDRPQSEYLMLLRDGVADRGWLVQGVERSGLYPPWAYTIGLSGFGLPELVVTGLPMRVAGDLLNGMAEHALHASPPSPGERIPLRGGPLVEVVALAEPSAHLVFAVALFGPEIRALQLVHADDQGRWPWSPDFRDGEGGQPVLGVRRAR